MGEGRSRFAMSSVIFPFLHRRLDLLRSFDRDHPLRKVPDSGTLQAPICRSKDMMRIASSVCRSMDSAGSEAFTDVARPCGRGTLQRHGRHIAFRFTFPIMRVSITILYFVRSTIVLMSPALPKQAPVGCGSGQKIPSFV
ncbi:hypothetical protein KP509_13G074200 [Ceratopteris richardii]|uniref:Uncharacterized protein n=1 Tax=Ceratopteris richardii TaxID=49495 RepID=A0A8T2TJ47_CERRI|nr:hypothetical protein KP509_13G074200 [Ceratopteris richardii]